MLAAASTTLGLASTAACAASSAGVVIEAPGSVREFCVELDGADIAGIDLLAATGVQLDVEDFGADNLTVCRIDDVGCEHPSEPCFCACRDVDRPCTFWGVYEIVEDAWEFSQVGLGQMRFGAGDVLGLRWTAQTEEGGGAPTVGEIDGLCERATKVATTTAEAGSGTPWTLIAAAAVVLIGLAWFARCTRVAG